MRRKIIINFLTLAGSLLLFFWTVQKGPFPLQKPPSSPETVAESKIAAVSEAVNAFGLDLLRQLRQSERENFFYSPQSIFSALAMTAEGTAGKTRIEFDNVLHLPAAGILREGFSALHNLLNARRVKAELHTVNAIWLQDGYPLQKDFLKIVKENYQARATALDFARKTEESRQTINVYICQQTREKIKELLKPGSISALTRLVLTNAIYFYSSWKYEFNPELTREDDFHISPQKAIKTSLMSLETDQRTFNYAENENLQILELPYSDEDLTMIIILPRKELAPIENSLNIKEWNLLLKKMRPESLQLIRIPAFKMETALTLNEHLQKLGLKEAFGRNADFSKITRAERLLISLVIHQANIRVDEKGTEAAAATAVVIRATTFAPNKKEFIANRPFLFFIVDRKSNTILFTGRVTNPKS